MEAAILKWITETQLFLKSMHTNEHLTNVIFVYYVNNHFMVLFSEYCTLLGIIGI